jgi:hypothetical protein
MQYNNVAFKLGYDRYLSEKTVMSFSADMGVNQMDFQSLSCAEPDTMAHSFTANYIRPEFNLLFFVDHNFAVGLNLSYHIVQRDYDPRMACINVKYESKELGGYMGYLNWGFGLYLGVIKKKK